MRYVSTRGKAPVLNFEEAMISGLATDGGLYLPESYPTFSPDKTASLQGLSYQELAYEVMFPFVEGSIEANVLRRLIDEAYSTFRHQAIAPLKQLDAQEWVLELFHGPTLAFKDFALQLLGRLLDYILERRNEHVVIVGATSGDTGSAAIEGCRHCSRAHIVILHPHNRVSPVQRRQMTTVEADNVKNIAIEGNFDDCQSLVKHMFMDQSFLGEKGRLIAVNSINWARIMAQIVYYFYAALQVGAPARSCAFSVPTGNFGDIFAGYVAKRMGLPIHQLIIATNSNDILHRFVEQNAYTKGKLLHTLSPSMDIQISSNFERLLFDIYDRDGSTIAELMENLNTNGTFSATSAVWEKIRALFASHSVDDDRVVEMIQKIHTSTGETLDPHTATGVAAARACRTDKNAPIITLATAHPAKFQAAIEKASLPPAPLPSAMQDLMEKEEHFTVLPNTLDAVTSYIREL